MAVTPTGHGTVVALNGAGLLLRGPPGSGKSSLALMLMAAGLDLVADDRVILSAANGIVTASAPPAIAGMIEARGVGILRADPAGPVPVVLVADLGEVETERLPPPRHTDLLGVRLPLVLGPASPHLCAALRQMLSAGRIA